ncbi:MAG: MlaD family protein [Acidobacteriia bacterium]|nr:MlaD family protein [Terriglobia bacterium]
MLEADRQRRLRVGLFTGCLLLVFGLIVLLIGKKQGLFQRHERYEALFEHVGGLVPGASVWLNGVVVGAVEEVELPTDPAQRQITVTFRINARLAERVRADSRVRIRTLGLLGDRYLEVSSGSTPQPPLAPGSVIPSEEPTDVAAVLSRGGDAMTNVQAISTSLRRILDRVERGEGILGELTVNPESGHQVIARLNSVLEETDGLLKGLRAGRGALGKLIADPKLESQLVEDLAGMAHAGREVGEALARDLARDDSVVAGLLRDPEGRERLQLALEGVGQAAAAATAAAKELTEGEGTLPRLMNDKEYARRFLDDLAVLTYSLRQVALKLDHGPGSAAQLINDPGLVRDLENVVRGVKDSKLATWYVRNRRARGEQVAPTPTVAAPTTPAPAPKE